MTDPDTTRQDKLRFLAGMKRLTEIAVRRRKGELTLQQTVDAMNAEMLKILGEPRQ